MEERMRVARGRSGDFKLVVLKEGMDFSFAVRRDAVLVLVRRCQRLAGTIQQAVLLRIANTARSFSARDPGF